MAKTIEQMGSNPAGIHFSDLQAVCQHYFGDPRNKGTSHYIYKTPWVGDPRINIQKGKGNKAKPYQVKQVLQAISILEVLKKNAEDTEDETEKK